jgi:hypothetical protein
MKSSFLSFSFLILFLLSSSSIAWGISLNEDEANGILLMREEEKLARDVYKFLSDKWKIKNFSNIYKSEVTHMAEMKTLIDKYSLKDPVVKDTAGTFTNIKLQKLYNDLISSGSKSEADSIKAGLLIEELDISDLNKLLAATANPEIKTVYENLLKGSMNHLKAFNNQAKKYGIIYKPEFITKKEYDDIIRQ